MRNLFTVNVETREHGFDEFLIRKSENTLKAQYDKNEKLIKDTVKKKLMPLIYLSVVALICGGIFIGIFMTEAKKADFSQAYSAAGWALYIGIAGIALFAILYLVIFIWMRKFLVSPQSEKLDNEQQELEEKIANGLCVPKDCAKIDIMCRPYKLKNGKEKYNYKSYENLPMWVFAEDGNLCFADLLGVWAVPISCISSINPFPGHATLSTWNKDEKFNSPKYNRTVSFYKGNYIVKGYYSLQFTQNSEEWEVLIPEYDIDCIYELIGKYPSFKY